MFSKAEFTKQIVLALDNLHDFVYLRGLPVTAALGVEDEPVDISVRRLQSSVLDAIERLNPDDHVSPRAKERRPYAIAYGRYVQGVTTAELADELAISIRQLRREHKRAVGAIVDLLWQQWRKQLEVSALSEDNVLDRYYKAASKFSIDTIVRVTSDCPFVDSEIVDDVISALSSSSADYASNHLLKRTWPHGFDVSAFTFSALEKAWLEAGSAREKEHVTPYIIEHPEIFDRVGISLDKDLSHLRVTVDYPEDIELCRILIEDYRAEQMAWREIVKLLEDHPELISINSLRVDSQS